MEKEEEFEELEKKLEEISRRRRRKKKIGEACHSIPVIVPIHSAVDVKQLRHLNACKANSLLMLQVNRKV